jgi:hypothetical protein
VDNLGVIGAVLGERLTAQLSVFNQQVEELTKWPGQDGLRQLVSWAAVAIHIRNAQPVTCYPQRARTRFGTQLRQPR